MIERFTQDISLTLKGKTLVSPKGGESVIA